MLTPACFAPFGIHSQLALERNAQRHGSARVHDEVVRRMADVLEPPDPAAHGWEGPCLVVDSEQLAHRTG